MDPLPAQIKLICNFPKGLTLGPHVANYFISFWVSCWTRLKRAPLPLGNLWNYVNSFLTQLTFAKSLANVSSPSSKSYIFFFKIFNMNCRNFWISFSCNVLLKCLDVGIEFGVVVHTCNDRRTYVRQGWQVNKLIFLQLTRSCSRPRWWKKKDFFILEIFLNRFAFIPRGG